MRSEIDHEDIVQAAVNSLVAEGKATAQQVLREAELVDTVLVSDCPFLGNIANISPACFPGDRFHLQYVELVLCA